MADREDPASGDPGELRPGHRVRSPEVSVRTSFTERNECRRQFYQLTSELCQRARDTEKTPKTCEPRQEDKRRRVAEDLPGKVHPLLDDLLRRQTPAYDSHEIWLEEEQWGRTGLSSQ